MNWWLRNDLCISSDGWGRELVQFFSTIVGMKRFNNLIGLVLTVSIFGLIVWSFFARDSESSVRNDTPSKKVSTQGLTVNFVGMPSHEGKIVAALYKDQASFEQGSAPLRRVELAKGDLHSEWIIEHVEPGSYAIAAFLDQNGNAKLDRNLFGVPTEAYGFSNNVRGKIGPPEYQACLIQVPSSSALEIRLR